MQAVTPYSVPVLSKTGATAQMPLMDKSFYSTASFGTSYSDETDSDFDSDSDSDSDSGFGGEDEFYFDTDEGEDKDVAGDFPSDTTQWKDYFESINYPRSPYFLPKQTESVAVAAAPASAPATSSTTAGRKPSHSATRKSSSAFFFNLPPSPSVSHVSTTARVQLRNLRLTPTVEEDVEEVATETEEAQEQQQLDLTKVHRHASEPSTPSDERYERAVYFAQAFASRNGGMSEALQHLIQLSSA